MSDNPAASMSSAGTSTAVAPTGTAARPEVVTAARGKPPTSDRVATVISHVVLTLWSLIVLLPLVWVFLSSFKDSRQIITGSPLALPKTLDFGNYARAWTSSGIGFALLNSVIVVGVALVLVMILGCAAAYSLARYPFPGSRAIYYLILAGLTFPIFLAIVPLFFVLKNAGLLNTLPGLILTYVAFAFPFTVFFMFPFFQGLPDEIAEAAELDGAGDWKTFALVMLPMARPGIVAVSIFNFLGLWNQFLLPVALNTTATRYVLAQAMNRFASATNYNIDYGALFAAVVITIVPVLIVYVIFQRQLQGSLSQGTMK